ADLGLASEELVRRRPQTAWLWAFRLQGFRLRPFELWTFRLGRLDAFDLGCQACSGGEDVRPWNRRRRFRHDVAEALETLSGQGWPVFHDPLAGGGRWLRGQPRWIGTGGRHFRAC